MTIDAVSPSTGADMTVDVETSGAGVLIVIREKGGERARVVAPADAITDVLAERPAGPRAVPGDQALVIEVRRNEVLLAVGGAEAAVGLDDLTDAVAACVTP